MFLKNLQISGRSGVIRSIDFHRGLNLIVDETLSTSEKATGNNVGKTTVLMLIDFCLGSSGKGVYTDPESKRQENATVKAFLTSNEVLISLTLKSDLSDPTSAEMLIERNFLARKSKITRINGQQKTEAEYEEALTESLFPGHFGKKPTFRQIISHNIRYKDSSINNTLKTLDSFTRDDEYETLYLFLLGCNFVHGDTKQNLLARIRVESAFKSRLESLQTRSAYETALALLLIDIQALNERRASFNVNANFEADLKALDTVKYKINALSAEIGSLNLRRELILEAVREINGDRSNIDMRQLRSLYEQAAGKLDNLHRTFEQLHEFHNRMVEEKARYVEKDLPALDQSIAAKTLELSKLLSEESSLAPKITKSHSFSELEKLIIELNEKHRTMGEYEMIIRQIETVDQMLNELSASLEKIDDDLFSSAFEDSIKVQLNKFNQYFASVSHILYGEQYALKVDQTTNKAKQRIYKFDAFNTNFSSGKKQGEISCFDIAYTMFADQEGIACYHFLLNDKKELMHDNQLVKISELVEKPSANVQFVASILKDKLPSALNDKRYFVVTLSQSDKLFRIEQQ